MCLVMEVGMTKRITVIGIELAAHVLVAALFWLAVLS